MEEIRKELDDHDNRLRRLETEIAENRKSWKVIEVMNELLSEIKVSTARTEENVRELRKDIEADHKEIQKLKDQRDQDHYVAPLTKKERLVEQVTNGIVMLVVGAVIGAILANIRL